MEVHRTFPGRRRVQLGDAAASGRLRLDAIARYLQDIATDDALDAGLADGWVVRRTTMHLDRLPRFREDVDLVTRCTGTTASAAERSTDLTVAGASAVRTVALWAFVGRDGRPQRLDVEAFAQYGIPHRERRLSTRLLHPDPAPGASRSPWSLRLADVDVLGHVNNSVSLAAFEEVLAGLGVVLEAPGVVEAEYRAPMNPGDEPVLAATVGPDGTAWCWIECAGAVRTSLRYSPGPV